MSENNSDPQQGRDWQSPAQPSAGGAPAIEGQNSQQQWQGQSGQQYAAQQGPGQQYAPQQDQGYSSGPYGMYPPADPRKSKLAAGLLGIFLGGLGIHNFYLGFTGKAITQLLISVISLGILSFVSIIWGLIEGILILTGAGGYDRDANGVPLKD